MKLARLKVTLTFASSLIVNNNKNYCRSNNNKFLIFRYEYLNGVPKYLRFAIAQKVWNVTIQRFNELNYEVDVGVYTR